MSITYTTSKSQFTFINVVMIAMKYNDGFQIFQKQNVAVMVFLHILKVKIKKYFLL